MEKPTIHLNGTSKNVLQDRLEYALEALNKARFALHTAGPHARDYYVQPGDAYLNAAREHLSRDQRLASVMDEIKALLEHVAAQEN